MSRILIDGYNLLAQTEYRERDRLISLLAKYKKSKRHDMTVVFDGTFNGTGMGDHYMEWGIEIIFSPLHVTADDVMLQMLKKSTASSWIVVSSDRKIQSAALGAGASFISSEEFVRKLKSSAATSHSIQAFPWMEGREEDWDDRSVKRSPQRKLSKKERQRRRRLDKL